MTFSKFCFAGRNTHGIFLDGQLRNDVELHHVVAIIIIRLRHPLSKLRVMIPSICDSFEDRPLAVELCCASSCPLIQVSRVDNQLAVLVEGSATSV